MQSFGIGKSTYPVIRLNQEFRLAEAAGIAAIRLFQFSEQPAALSPIFAPSSLQLLTSELRAGQCG